MAFGLNSGVQDETLVLVVTVKEFRVTVIKIMAPIVCCFRVVSFMDQIRLEPRPDWSPLGA